MQPHSAFWLDIRPPQGGINNKKKNLLNTFQMKPVWIFSKRHLAFFPAYLSPLFPRPSHRGNSIQDDRIHGIVLGFFFLNSDILRKCKYLEREQVHMVTWGEDDDALWLQNQSRLSQSHFHLPLSLAFRAPCGLWSPQCGFSRPCKSHLSTLRSATRLGKYKQE